MSLRTGSRIQNRCDSMRLSHLVAFCVLLLGSACSGLPSHPEIDEKAEEFSARRARAHYSALRELGPRAPGTEAAARARAYVERELRWAGARVVEAGPGEHGAEQPVLAWLPGASEDRILVAAPWAPATSLSFSMHDSLSFSSLSSNCLPFVPKKLLHDPALYSLCLTYASAS